MDANKIDVDALFKQYTIKEIQAIELQVKNEIEKKKEDLRIMVYNRYRDIIDAADGIHVMKSCSKQIETVLSELQTTCDTVFTQIENSTFVNQDKLRASEKSKRNNKYILAVIIKILQNSPSKIWYHLDNYEYVKAAKQYLLAQHAHICLELEPNLKTLENSTNHIQYANELWNSIVFLTKTIADQARDTFTDLNVNMSKVFTDAMSAIYLLENSSLKEIFQEFLLKRTPLIKSLIDIESNEKTYSINDRVLKCLRSFVNTINHIYNLFSNDSENKTQSFEDTINDTTFTIESLKDDGFVITKIPNYLKNVKFKDTDKIKRFEADYLSEKANIWLTRCLNDLHQGFLETFKYVKSLKNLVEIRDVVIEFEGSIKQDAKTMLTNQHCSWTHICNILFKKDISIWSEMVSPFYYSQATVIIESSIKKTKNNLINNLKECLSDKAFYDPVSNSGNFAEIDINSYMWSMENSHQAFMNSSSKNNKHTIDFMSSKTLSSVHLKTLNKINQHNVTPAIKQLCKGLDDDLNYLLEDIEFTTKLPGNKNNTIMTDVITDDFNRCNEYLETNLNLFREDLAKSLGDLINAIKLDAEETQKVSKILLICRLTNALVNFSSPSLKICFNNVSEQFIKQRKNQLIAKLSETNDIMQILNATKKKANLNEQKIVDKNWLKFTEEFQEICKIGFKIWIDNLCAEIKTKYLDKVENPTNKSEEPTLAINDLIAWDEIEIEDELDPTDEQEETTEKTDTEAVKSKLHAPLVCSPLIQNILYTICQNITKNFSYNMIDSNLILKNLILNVFELIIKAYQAIVLKQNSNDNEKSIKLTQNQSLQMLFDIRFLYTLFDLKSFQIMTTDKDNINRIQEEYKKLTSDLEGFIDPFDYDICSPFIQSNISKSISRSSALYGILNTSERFARSNISGTSITTDNDKFNLLLLSNNQQRFELLPLPSLQSQQQVNNEKQQNLFYKNQTTNLKFDEVNKKSSTSKQLADSVNSASAGLSNVFKWFQ